MKQIFQRFTAALLALALLAGQGALASEALGWDLHAGTSVLSEGTTLTTGYFWSDTYGDLRTERYLTYTPNENVTPTLAYGNTVFSKMTLSKLAKQLESQGKRVLGGTNGDFFVMSSGQPLGIVITDGVVRSSSSYHYAVGFRADGTAMIGRPGLQVTAVLSGERVGVSGGVNKTRSLIEEGGGLLLLTGDFGSSTGNYYAGVDVVLRPLPVEKAPEDTAYAVGGDAALFLPGENTNLTLAEDLRVGRRVRCTVESVNEAEGPAPIPEGCWVLTMNGQDAETVLEKLRALQTGDTVSIEVTAADRQWEEAVTAMGAMYRLLENGEVLEAPQAGDSVWSQQTARTAIGVRADGSVIFYTLDGKISGVSVGASLTQVAKRLKELGCVEAIGLDGGGSTTMGATAMGQDALQVVNRPKEGTQRAVTNAIFLTTEMPATGEPSFLQIDPEDPIMLGGASLGLTAYQVDTGYRRMEAASDVSWELQGDGTMTGNVFTAGDQDGVTVVTAAQGGLTGSTTLTTVRTPDRITLLREDTGEAVTGIYAQVGETFSLKAYSYWRNLFLRCQDTCYIWSCDEAVGTVTADGTFTAGESTAAGKLYVTAGDRTVSIPVTVAGRVLELEDMEGPLPFSATLTGTGGGETAPAHVRMGKKSLRMEYDMTLTGQSELNAALPLPQGEKYLGLWVYGDGSGNVLWARFDLPGSGQDESTYDIGADAAVLPVEGGTEICTLDFSGWRHVLLTIPQGASALTGLTVTPGEGEVLTGTVWLDHFTTANEALEDLVPPTVQVTISENVLTARVSDQLDDRLPAGAVSARYDGRPLDGTWNEETGTFTAVLPEVDGNRHRITVTARDRSGNLGRGSADLEGVRPVPFVDMEDHWAAGFVTYLREQGISYGEAAADGYIYKPEKEITRAEFFAMVARWMGLGGALYEGVELPFADAEDIPAWALASMRAMYAEGVMAGSRDNGVLYARPNDSITRAEVMAILSRTQAKGWAEADLSRYADCGEVPLWAEADVKSLVGQGVVRGYEDGTLRPGAPMTRAEVAVVLCTMR